MMQLIKQSFIAEFEVFEYDALPNTMDIAATRKSNTVIMTQDQQNAKGKGDRKWETFPGNLYFSFVLETNNKFRDYSQLSFLSGVAMREAAGFLTGENTDVKCKWPNDVLLNEKKFCGILLNFEPQKNQLIIGIGVNVKHFPKDTMYIATSIYNEGFANVDAKKLLEEFLLRFSDLYKIWQKEGFAKIREQWLKKAYHFNQEITVKTGEFNFKGIFENLDKDGTLIVRMNKKDIKKIKSGDIF
jgi:BirA family transcriptional regulator, biotin operon repressor / biotin---[acetyl-CoA-carboxylase] ligase